jgi:dTMP kinase
MGRFIVVEAIDLAGKSTAVTTVAEALRSTGLTVGEYGYPDREAPLTGPLLRRLLAGDLQMVERTGPAAAARQMQLGQLIFSLNRIEVAPTLEHLMQVFDVVISSRYQMSGRAYGEAGGVAASDMAAMIASVEHGLRQPDLVLVLDVSPAEVIDRPRSGGLDAFERDRALQERTRSFYLSIAASDPSVIVIDGSGSQAQVRGRVLAAVGGLADDPASSD